MVPVLFTSKTENAFLSNKAYIRHFLVAGIREVDLRVHEDFQKLCLRDGCLGQLLKVGADVPVELGHLGVDLMVLEEGDEGGPLHGGVLGLVD